MNEPRGKQAAELAAVATLYGAAIALPVALVARATGRSWSAALEAAGLATLMLVVLGGGLAALGRLPRVRRFIEAQGDAFPLVGPSADPRSANVERRAAKLIHKAKLTADGVLAAVVAACAFAWFWVSSPLLGTVALAGLLVFRIARTQRRWLALRGHSIEITEVGLVQHDAAKREVARVVFAEPITYEYLDRGPGSAIFALTQGSQVMQFATNIPNAPEVAATLGLPWPVRDAAWRDAA